ncbi:MAG: hypothetical protein WBX25_02005 [Rhodomicrobium sp.]
MASERQIAASQRNGRLSRGPKTKDGKARSSRNALRHGLSARKNLLARESEAEYVELYEELCASLKPKGALEIQLAQQIVSVLWRMRRIPVFEAALLASLREETLREMEERRALDERLASLYAAEESSPSLGEIDEEDEAGEEDAIDEENPMDEEQEEQTILGSVVSDFFKHDFDGKLGRHATSLLRQFSGLTKELNAVQERGREEEKHEQERANSAAANETMAEFSEGV